VALLAPLLLILALAPSPAIPEACG
jgi:hypothetical protein